MGCSASKTAVEEIEIQNGTLVSRNLIKINKIRKLDYYHFSSFNKAN